MKKLLPKFNKTPFIQFAQKGVKTKTTKIEEEELPEEEIETSEEINEAIPVVVAPLPKPVPVYGPSSPVVGSYGFDPTHQPWSTQFSEEDKANYKEVSNNKDAGLYVPVEEAVDDYTYYSAAKGRVNSTLNEIQQYWEGPVAKHRLKYMSKGNDEDESFNDTDVQEKRRRVKDIKASTTSSFDTTASPYQETIRINPYLDAFDKNMGAGVAGLTAHEAAHVLYKPDEMENDYSQLSPEYKAALDKISPSGIKTINGKRQFSSQFPIYTPYAGKEYYLNSGTVNESVFTFDKNGNYKHIRGQNFPSKFNEFMNNWEKTTLKHDSDINEKIPFIYETREAMRKSGMWDYTTGEPLTKRTLNDFKAKFPNTRLLNYTDDDNALWLLNVTAQNNTENTQHNMA